MPPSVAPLGDALAYNWYDPWVAPAAEPLSLPAVEGFQVPQPPPLPTGRFGGDSLAPAGLGGDGLGTSAGEPPSQGPAGGQTASLPVVPLSPQAPPKVPEPPPVREVVPPILGADDSDDDRPRWLPTWDEAGSFLLSSLVHAILFLLLGALVGGGGGGQSAVSLDASFTESLSAEALAHTDFAIVEPQRDRAADTALSWERGEASPTPLDMPTLTVPLESLRQPIDSQQLARGSTPRSSDLGEATDVALSKALQGRALRFQGKLGGRGDGSGGLRGPTPQSEAAVERALRWLAAHQGDDGGWNFDHTRGLCQGMCRDRGSQTSTTAATALALLPFLGAGYTHLHGEHRDTIHRGIYYLKKRGRATPNGLDLQEGTMYAQGLAAIALCEAYAMTEDPAIKDLAQGAIDFIVWAQDKNGGGWRYRPGEPGDTTVSGWQLMALKSGQMARLKVPRPASSLAERFRNSVQRDKGAQYGYVSAGTGTQTTTAIGLLCRMWTGWTRANPGLRRGVVYLEKWGPSHDDMYYNYYATQVLFHWGGRGWELWNAKLRDYLVNTQATKGHEAGSWHFSGRWSHSGGRLYNTAMAAMILEVYYRHMPLYDHKVFQPEP